MKDIWFQESSFLLEDSDVSLIWLILLPTRECVRFALFRPRLVRYYKVEIREEEGPSCLSSSQDSSCGKVLQILMVTEDYDLVLGTMEILSPLFECCNDSQKFLIIDVIVNFR